MTTIYLAGGCFWGMPPAMRRPSRSRLYSSLLFDCFVSLLNLAELLRGGLLNFGSEGCHLVGVVLHRHASVGCLDLVVCG